jgi:hypothetical protein
MSFIKKAKPVLAKDLELQTKMYLGGSRISQVVEMNSTTLVVAVWD